MQLLDLTLDTAAANLALDEALLESAEIDVEHDEVLRIWESPKPIVVLGRSSPFQREVNLSYCDENSIEILRRSSGGQTVVAGPGCLMYCVLISYRKRPQLRMIDRAHQFVMSRIQECLLNIGIEVQISGICDLTIDNRKVSGNSLRCKKNFFIYHGTFLYDFAVELIQNCLNQPIRKPDYRGERSHHDFVTTIPLTAATLRSVLCEAFKAKMNFASWPEGLTQKLAQEKYSDDGWNRRH